MKRVLIVVPSFNHGGTNRSLWNLLNSKNNDDYEISVLAMDPRGPYKEKMQIFKLVEPIGMLSVMSPLGKTAGLERIKRIAYKLYFKVALGGSKQRLYSQAGKKIKNDEYDVVVSFQEGAATEFASYIPARKRIAWVRCDYSNYLRLSRKSDESEIYKKFDNIVCVSRYTAGVFSSFYPDFADKVLSVYNIIDTAGIIRTSSEKIDDDRFDNTSFTLVSVGRMDAVKRFSHIPCVAKKMKEQGCDFKWYIIGSGGAEEEKVVAEIKNCGVESNVIMLGSKNNPYPYIANSDVLVCPSITEACPNVVNEAKILHVPPVAADFPSAPEYIDSGVNGVISTMENMAEVLTRLCLDKEYYKTIKNGISDFEYKNDEIRSSLDKLMLE